MNREKKLTHSPFRKDENSEGEKNSERVQDKDPRVILPSSLLSVLESYIDQKIKKKKESAQEKQTPYVRFLKEDRLGLLYHLTVEDCEVWGDLDNWRLYALRKSLFPQATYAIHETHSSRTTLTIGKAIAAVPESLVSEKKPFCFRYNDYDEACIVPMLGSRYTLNYIVAGSHSREFFEIVFP